MPLPDEPAWRTFLEELGTFIPSRGGRAAFRELTERELEILDLVASGRDNAQIAAQLDLSEKTVRNNITRIFDKLAVENRPQAIVLARERDRGEQAREQADGVGQCHAPSRARGDSSYRSSSSRRSA
jgi:DNA-binding CsgD family transcriptional regulator